jgi:hypothetical protein
VLLYTCTQEVALTNLLQFSGCPDTLSWLSSVSQGMRHDWLFPVPIQFVIYHIYVYIPYIFFYNSPSLKPIQNTAFKLRGFVTYTYVLLWTFFFAEMLPVLKMIRTKLNFKVRSSVLVTLRPALFWVIKQRVVVIFCTDFWGNLLVLSSGVFFGGGDTWPLKMGPIGCPTTSVKNYHYSLRNNPEERSSQLLHDGSLKSRIFLTLTAAMGKK